MSNEYKKRRTVFIKRDFQIKFISWVVGLLVICCLCSAAVLYPMISSEIDSGLTSGHPNAGGIKNNMALALLVGNMLAIVVATLATTVVILYISHKIAGPLYRFESICKEIGRGNLNVPARLRKMDQLKGLSEAFAKMLTQLRNRCCDQYTRLEKARSDLNALQEAPADSSASRKLVKSVDNLLASLADEMKENARPEPSDG